MFPVEFYELTIVDVSIAAIYLYGDISIWLCLYGYVYMSNVYMAATVPPSPNLDRDRLTTLQKPAINRHSSQSIRHLRRRHRRRYRSIRAIR